MIRLKKCFYRKDDHDRKKTNNCIFYRQEVRKTLWSFYCYIIFFWSKESINKKRWNKNWNERSCSLFVSNKFIHCLLLSHNVTDDRLIREPRERTQFGPTGGSVIAAVRIHQVSYLPLSGASWNGWESRHSCPSARRRQQRNPFRACPPKQILHPAQFPAEVCPVLLVLSSHQKGDSENLTIPFTRNAKPLWQSLAQPDDSFTAGVLGGQHVLLSTHPPKSEPTRATATTTTRAASSLDVHP